MRVRVRLTDLGWSYADLAERIGVHYSTIGDILTRSVASKHVRAIERALELRPPAVLRLEEFLDRVSPERQEELVDQMIAYAELYGGAAVRRRK